MDCWGRTHADPSAEQPHELDPAASVSHLWGEVSEVLTSFLKWPGRTNGFALSVWRDTERLHALWLLAAKAERRERERTNSEQQEQQPSLTQQDLSVLNFLLFSPASWLQNESCASPLLLLPSSTQLRPI